MRRLILWLIWLSAWAIVIFLAAGCSSISYGPVAADRYVGARVAIGFGGEAAHGLAAQQVESNGGDDD